MRLKTMREHRQEKLAEKYALREHVHSVIHDPVISAYGLNLNLEKINKWTYQWKMAFNPEKMNSPNHQPLYFNMYTNTYVIIFT